MKEAANEQIEAQVQGAEAQNESGTESEISLGKFKDVKSLLQAYNSLESEFTKRCQRIKELEGAAASVKTEVSEQSAGELKGTSDEKEEILKDYLKGILKSRQSAVLLGEAGVGVKAPADKPKTIAEAGMLAKEIFKKTN
ncbi:MAG: hypothetical protein SPL13_03935 [Clostridia bacterium]|nr:hypothetical protein [Clostridia bacterium]